MRFKTFTKIVSTLLLALCSASAVWADTLVHRNGSIFKGTFIGFENGEFIFKLSSSSPRSQNQSQTIRVAARDVVKLTLDSEGTDSGNSGNNGNVREDRFPRRDPSSGGTSGNSGNAGWRSYPPVDVRLDDQWIRSNIEVRRGQVIRVEATGTIRLDSRTSSGPEGLRTRADQNAPEPGEADGVLLAGVGQDANSPSIVIGRSREFTAESDGMLYFTVNHGDTRSTSGAYQVRVQVDQSSNGGSGGNNTGGSGNNSGQRGQERNFNVPANLPWTETGIDVEPGMRLDITAEGAVTVSSQYRNVGPDGEMRAQVGSSRYPVQNAGVGALLVKIRYRDGRDSDILVVGRGTTANVEAGEFGRLMLGINDDFFRDNSGSFSVRVRW